MHREDGRSARLKAQGAEIAVADALKDVQRAYYSPPFDPYMIQGAVAFAVAAKLAVPGRDKVAPATTSRTRSLEFQ